MKALRWVLLPLSLLYGLIVFIRNKLYDWNVFKSFYFPDTTTIVVGNLAVGGTGKTPMIEYLIRLLKNKHKIATLSRGYGRQTKGYRIVEADDAAAEVGDEPLQLKRKFSDITITVSENRCAGIKRLKNQHNLILLDDAFQHRKLQPSFSILLFQYRSLLSPIVPLPTGNFRDLMNQTKRADAVIITKSPFVNNNQERRQILNRIRRYSNCPVFFSTISYDKHFTFRKKQVDVDLSTKHILLITGIANPASLREHLKGQAKSVQHLSFPDHHSFSNRNIEAIKKQFQSISHTNKIIVTTEKDAQRLPSQLFDQIPIYVLSIKTSIEESERFNEWINSKL